MGYDIFFHLLIIVKPYEENYCHYETNNRNGTPNIIMIQLEELFAQQYQYPEKKIKQFSYFNLLA